MRALALLLSLAASCSSGSVEAPREALPSSPTAASSLTRPEPAPIEPIVELAAPEPAPPPYEPFAGRHEVSVGELFVALEAEVETVVASPAVRGDYEQFLAHFELADDDELYRDYARIKLAFEATRAGGLWGLQWTITNELPQSDRVWAQWQGLALPHDATMLPLVTASAECDELSALFAFVVHRIGLSKRSEVGLLWPTSNHVVAVWTIDRKSEHPTRVVVPNSQIFLSADQSLGTAEFDPWRQKTIFDYRRADAKLELALPARLAHAMLVAVHEHGGRSQAELQAMRNAREERQWAADAS